MPKVTEKPAPHTIPIPWLHKSCGSISISFDGLYIVIGDVHSEYQVHIPQSISRRPSHSPQPNFLSYLCPSCLSLAMGHMSLHSSNLEWSEISISIQRKATLENMSGSQEIIREPNKQMSLQSERNRSRLALLSGSANQPRPHSAASLAYRIRDGIWKEMPVSWATEMAALRSFNTGAPSR